MTQSLPNLRNLPIEARVDPAPEDGDLHELWLAVRRQIWMVGICTCLGLVAGALHYATSPREFEAGASVMIEQRLSDLEQELSASLPLSRNDTAFQNEIQILQSQHIAIEVVRALDLHQNRDFMSPPQSALGQFRSDATRWVKGLITPEVPSSGGGSTLSDAQREERRIVDAATRLAMRTKFSRQGRSSTVWISFTSHVPLLAAAIPNAYAEAYLADGTRANVEASDRMTTWMRGRIEELRVAALEAAREAEEFRAETGAMDQQGLRERDQRAEALNELFLTVQSRYQQLALESSFPVTTGRVLTQAVPPRRPAAPSAVLLLGAGLVLGMIVGLGIAVLREYRETGFRTGQDIERVARLAFLGYFPALKPRALRRAPAPSLTPAQPMSERFVSSRNGAEDGEPGLSNPEAPQGPSSLPAELCVAAFAPRSAADKALRNILATLDLGFEETTGRVIAIGAVMEDEGATTVAANLANLAALSGRRTLLIDGDFEGSELSRRLGVTQGDGTLGVLDGSVDLISAICRLPYSGVDLLPTGAGGTHDVRTGPSHLAGLAELVTTARQSYDDIIIDLPSLGLGPEAKALVRSIDRVVLVTRWGKTPRRSVRAFLDHEREIARRTAGVVLNRANLRQLPRYGVQLWRSSLFPTTTSG
ncbi:MAG: Wzz/FepE/Etk N-terminal domain-containing protein [Pseudomonadota bacterium]